ncbi:MAG: PAS domain S-box protein [Planctomycetota bacterium]
MPQNTGSLVVTTVAADGRATRTFPLAPGDKVTFGRTYCDVTLDSPTCSREHFEVANLDGECILRDIGSRNGSFVNGEQVVTRALAAGDTIEAGVIVVQVQGTLSGPSLQVAMEVQGLIEAAPEIQPLEKTAKMRKSKSTVAGRTIAELRKKGRPVESTQAIAAVQDVLPPIWQVCETLFDEPHGQLELARLPDTLVASAGADRAAVMALPAAGDGEARILADSSRPGTAPALPLLPEMVKGCAKLRGAISVPNVADDRRYQDAVRGDELPGAAVTYALVASLEKQYGVLYVEWRAAENPEQTFAWTSSLARQVGLLAERNELADELRQSNKTLELAVEQRTRELTEANERLRREIAERRDAEEALRKSEEWHRSLIELGASVYAVVDAQGKVLYESPNLVQVYGWRPEDLVGKSVFELVHPDDIDYTAQKFGELVGSPGLVKKAELRLRHKDGSWRNLEVGGVNLLDNPAVSGIVITSHDITDRKRAEEALRRSEERFRALVESTSDWVWEVDAGGVYTYASPKVKDLLGYEPEEVIGKRPSDLMPPAEAERVASQFAAIAESRKPFARLENVNRHKDGRSVVLETSGVPLLDDEGKLRGFRGIDRDITDRRQAEEALAGERALLRTLIDNLPDLIYIKDSESRFVTGNLAVARLMGAGEPQDLVGKTDFDFFPKELASGFRADEEEVMRSGKPLIDRIETAIGADGQTRWLSSTKVPLRDSDGNVTGIVGMGRDITERRQAEEALAESEAKFRLLAEQALMGIMILQGDRVKYVNSAMAAIIGSTVEDLSRHGLGDILEYVHPDDRAFVMEQARKKQAGDPDVVTHYVYHGLRKSGEDAWIELYSKTLVYEGKPADLVTILDITERHRAEEERAGLEEQLRHTQKMEAVGTLAGGIAHDFSNLLTGILGYAQVLKLKGKPGDDVVAAADVIERAATRAGELTTQLLDFARRGKLQNVPVDMHRVMGDVLAILSRTIDKRIDMAQRLRADPPLVTGDPSQLEQVVMNLAVNACDAMRDGGRLTLETSTVDLDEERCRAQGGISPGRYLAVSVADTGVGIPDEIRDRIFEPFFTTKEPGKGTGMGLAMVYGIVKSHGGSIEIESEAGSGAAFTVYLPLAKDTARCEIPEPKKALVYGTGMILVVDDEESVRKSVESTLSLLGYDVVTAHDGREAVEFYKDHAGEVDLVVLDMVMPIMDGRECFKRLKKLDPGVKVLLATGRAPDGAAQELLIQGVLGFIKKPFAIADLSEAVAKTLGGPLAGEAKVAKPAAPGGARRDGRPFRVLVVDDEETVRETIVRFLESMGCEVTAVSNAEDAVSTFLKDGFDLVTLDFKMPGLDGMELHKVLSQEFGSGKRTDGPAAKTLPSIVVVTAYAEAPEVVGRQFGESIVGIVRKPLIEEELGRIVRELIAKRPGREEPAG